MGSMPTPLLIAQLTDTHVIGADTTEELFVDNNARLDAAVRRLDTEQPEMSAVLGTGDLTNGGAPDEYATLVELLAPLRVPFLPLPGNHDDRDLLRAAFPDTAWTDADHASWVTTISRPDGTGVRVIGLDSTIPGAPGAGFDDDRARWLESAVTADVGDDTPTILAMHHPPFVTGIDWMDRSGFGGRERLVALLTEHPVDRIVCGHFHRPISSSVAGIAVQVGVSTVQHVDLDLATHSTPSLIRDPVGYQILRVDGRDIVSHTRYIDTGEERIIPTWAGEFTTPPVA